MGKGRVAHRNVGWGKTRGSTGPEGAEVITTVITTVERHDIKGAVLPLEVKSKAKSKVSFVFYIVLPIKAKI